MKIAIVVLSTGFLLSACTLSLAGDITPPPIAVGEQSGFYLEFPTAVPDAALGAAIYAENCAPCHGVSGRGDGAQAAQLPFPPAALANPSVARGASPVDWYRLISSGNLERLMPPFDGSLSVQERWDVLAYAYSLSWDDKSLRLGGQIFEDYRQELAGIIIEPVDLSQMARLSQAELSKQLSLLLPEATSEETAALAGYVQAVSLGYEVNDVVTQPLEGEGTAETAVFQGEVINGSGTGLPANLAVTFFGFDHDALALAETASVDSVGEFRFANIPLVEDRIYFVQVDHGGLSYFSELISPDAGSSVYDLTVTVYETTSDTSQLEIDRIHFVLEFPRTGFLRVVQQVSISNHGNRAVAPAADGQPVLHFGLPARASNLAFSEGLLGERYVGQGDGFGDLRAVLPGESTYQLLFAYDLPYSTKAKIEIPVNLRTRNVIAFIQDLGVDMRGSSFQPIGSQPIEGQTYAAYEAKDFDPGSVIDLELSGSHPLGSPGLAADADLLFGLGALTAAVGAAWLWLRTLPDRGISTPDNILDKIVELDSGYERGELTKTEHKKLRTLLKKQLENALKGQT
jgi:hypothetical protein